jgi:hypothetical protein
MLIITRNLHTTYSLAREAFVINGVEMTREQVLQTRPIERSVAHWLVLVDWDLWETKPFVVVDPYNPNSLLYLTQADYLSLGKICASNDLTFLVVASPVTKRPVPVDPSSSQNSPLPVGFESKWTRASRASWKAFLDLRRKIRTGVPIVKDSTMVSERPDTVAKTVYLWVRELLHYIEVKNPGRFPELLQPLVQHLRTVLRNNGQMSAVKHLKVSLFVLYSFVAGNPVQSTHPLGYPIRLRNGLPACWSKELRDMVRSGNLPIIRLMASLLNLYRAWDAKHPEFDTGTITTLPKPFTEDPLFLEYQKFCKDIFPTMLKTLSGKEKFRFRYESAFGLLLRTAAPNFSGPSSAATVLDAQAWRAAPENHILEWFKMHKDHLMVQNLEAQEIEHQFLPRDLPGDTGDASSPWHSVLTIGRILQAVRPSLAYQANGGPILGRLHTIDEPAGKVRVVAICDYWTQAGLKPVHDYLFEILRCIPQDATFDQDGIVQSYYQRGLSPHWSFDLKSATDLIPLTLYKELLKHFLICDGEEDQMGEVRTQLWAKILTDRDWHLPPRFGPDKELLPPETVRYGTGQPMGALSSWASMALVHHSLVQFAAYKATGKAVWFTDYLVLGDDVDIASREEVATSYQEICTTFGIIIGLAKSLHSKQNAFEFANRRFIPQGDVSPISFREELASSTWSERIEFAKRILLRLGKPLSTPALLRRAVTEPQWTIVSPELSGRRTSSVLRLIEYCLHNPFNSLESLKETCISSILKWVTNVIPDKDIPRIRDIMVDTLQAGHLSWRFQQYLRNEIKETFKNLFERDLPKIVLQEGPSKENSMFVRFAEPTFGQNSAFAAHIAGMRNQFPQCPEELRSHLDGALRYYDAVIEQCRKLELTPYITAPMSPVAWQYFLYCLNRQNMKWLSGLFRLWLRFDGIDRRFPVEHSSLYYHVIGESGDKTLRDLLEIWIELKSTPKVLSLDLNHSISWNFDYNSSRDNLERAMARALKKPWKKPVRTEHVFGPMLELSRVIAQFCGTMIPNLPFFAMAKRGKHWHKVVERAVAYNRGLSESLLELSLAEHKFAIFEANRRRYDRNPTHLGRG